MTFLCEYRDCREAVLGHGRYCEKHNAEARPELFPPEAGKCIKCGRPRIAERLDDRCQCGPKNPFFNGKART